MCVPAEVRVGLHPVRKVMAAADALHGRARVASTSADRYSLMSPRGSCLSGAHGFVMIGHVPELAIFVAALAQKW